MTSTTARQTGFDMGDSANSKGLAVPARNFPQRREQFAEDERIAYDQVKKLWILEDYDGSQWEYNERYSKWARMVDEADIERHLAGFVYRGDENADSASQVNKKRKNDEEGGNDSKRTRNAPEDTKKEPVNTAIYLKNLPPDTDEHELAIFCGQAGLLEEDLDTGAPRVKLYLDKKGNPKGDAVVHFHKFNSVGLALDVLDGRPYRANKPFENVIEVTEADFSTYGKKEKKKGPKEEGRPGPTDPASRKKALVRSKTKLNHITSDWGDDDPSAIVTNDMRDAKFVVLTNMFRVEEIKDSPIQVKAMTKRVEQQCGRFGELVKVVVFDLEPDGIVRARFKTPQAAQACVTALHRKLTYNDKNGKTVVVEAFLSDGQEVFRKSRGPPPAKKVPNANSPEEERVDANERPAQEPKDVEEKPADAQAQDADADTEMTEKTSAKPIAGDDENANGAEHE